MVTFEGQSYRDIVKPHHQPWGSCEAAGPSRQRWPTASTDLRTLLETGEQ